VGQALSPANSAGLDCASSTERYHEHRWRALKTTTYQSRQKKTAPAAGTASATTGASTAATTQGKGGPQVSHAVATTSGSGVVVTTMTHTANGKVIVTHVRHSTYRDN